MATMADILSMARMGGGGQDPNDLARIMAMLQALGGAGSAAGQMGQAFQAPPQAQGQAPPGAGGNEQVIPAGSPLAGSAGSFRPPQGPPPGMGGGMPPGMPPMAPSGMPMPPMAPQAMPGIRPPGPDAGGPPLGGGMGGMRGPMQMPLPSGQTPGMGMPGMGLGPGAAMGGIMAPGAGVRQAQDPRINDEFARLLYTLMRRGK